MNQITLDLGFTDPEMPILDRSRCSTRPISQRTAARMVERFHYAHRVPSIIAAVGMYVDDVLAGCVTYGNIPADNATAICGSGFAAAVLELNRLYIHDWAGRNSESWLIGQSFRWLAERRPEYQVLISYADSAHGHRGCIYQATNWLYTGESTHTAYRDPNGDVLHGRSCHDYRAERQLSQFRTPQCEAFQQEPKHRYVHFLGDRRQRRALRQALKWPVLPYPKGAA